LNKKIIFLYKKTQSEALRQTLACATALLLWLLEAAALDPFSFCVSKVFLKKFKFFLF